MFKKWIKGIVEEVLQERVEQVNKVTQALLNQPECNHEWGPWKEDARYKISRGESHVETAIMMERTCTKCKLLEPKRVIATILDAPPKQP